MGRAVEFICVSALIALCLLGYTAKSIQYSYNELQETKLAVQERMHAKDIEIQRLNIGYRE